MEVPNSSAILPSGGDWLTCTSFMELFSSSALLIRRYVTHLHFSGGSIWLICTSLRGVSDSYGLLLGRYLTHLHFSRWTVIVKYLALLNFFQHAQWAVVTSYQANLHFSHTLIREQVLHLPPHGLKWWTCRYRSGFIQWNGIFSQQQKLGGHKEFY